MSKASLELGGGNWGTKDGNLLAYAQGNESSKFVPREFTFTRGSDIAATRINSSGSIEKYRENLLLQSNQFDTTWSQSGTTRTIGQSGYDGSSDAWKIARDGAAGLAFVYQTISSTGVQTFSLYAKANTEDWIYLQDTATGGGGGYFDLANGTAGTTSGIDSSIDSVGDGWYRIQIVSNRTTSGNIRIFVASANANLTVTGSIYIQDAQLERGLVATSYLESGATTATSGVADNEPRIDYAGGTASLLLEPSRTNLVRYSELINPTISGLSWAQVNTNTFTTNYGTAPDGTQTSTLIQFATTNSSSQLYHLINFSAGDYTTSIYAKGSGSFKLGIFDNTNVLTDTITLTSEWQRFKVTKTALATSNGRGVWIYPNGDGDTIEIWGGQVEEGSYPTSYIPTYGTSVTRNADDLNDLDISSMLTTSSFTWFLDLNDYIGSDINNSNIWLQSTSSVRIQFRVLFDGYRFYYSGIAGGSTFPIAGSTTANKFCVSYDGNDYRLYVDGVLQATTASVGDSGWDKIRNSVLASLPLKQMQLFPTTLTDAECITLTFPDNPLLLNYYPNAAAAYSLRQLVAFYNGNAVRVRRASDNTEQDIGFVNNVLDTSSLETFCSGTDGFVTTWYDQSGNGNNVTQATASAQPKIVSSGSTITENGKPVVQFDGGNDQLTDSFSTTYNQPTYSFLVHNFTSAPSAFDGVIGSIGTEHRLIMGATLKYTLQAGGSLSYNEYSTDQSLVSYKIQQSDPKLFFNGTQQSVSSGSNIGTTGLQGLVLGGISSGSSSGNTPVQIQELVIFDSDQDDNRSGIETNINDYYSIYTP